MTDTNPPADRAPEPRRTGPSSYRGIGQPPPATVEGVIAELEVFESLRRIHNDGIAPGQYNVRLMDPAYVIARGNFGHDGANFARILADEVDRLSARVEELERQLGKARADYDELIAIIHDRPMKISVGGTEEPAPEPTTAPDSVMDPFEAADDMDRRWE
jgi:hypothetical protein